jgi:hypothetical protein
MGYHQSREMYVEGQPGNYYVQTSEVVCQRPGATAIEYGLIAARVPVAIIAVLLIALNPFAVPSAGCVDSLAP